MQTIVQLEHQLNEWQKNNCELPNYHQLRELVDTIKSNNKELCLTLLSVELQFDDLIIENNRLKIELEKYK